MAALSDDGCGLAAVRRRVRELFWTPSSEAREQNDTAIDDLLARQITDPAHPQCGGWGDVTDAASKRLNYSLGQVLTLARGWGDEESRHFHDTTLAERLTLAARFYTTCLMPEEPFPNNWFFWQVGFLYELRDIFLLAGDALDDDAHAALLHAFTYLVEKIWDFHAPANRMYTAVSILGLAIVTGDEALMKKAADWAEESTIYIDGRSRDPQGFRDDGTYFFHGARINLAYGATHLDLLGKAWYLLADTPWQLSEKTHAHARRLLLECAQWTIFGRRIDPFILDRMIAMPGDPSATTVRSFLDCALLFLGDSPQSDPELISFARRLLASGVQPTMTHTARLAKTLPQGESTPLCGGRYFTDAEYCALQGNGWAAGIKMATWHTATYAGINRLNRKGWHISDGQPVLRTTDEAYDDTIFPTMDWERLSGITRAGGFRIPNETMGHSMFAAGAHTPDGTRACCGLDFSIRMPDDQTELAARKNWFFLGDAIVATGSDIWTTASVQIETVIRQVPLPAEWEAHEFEEGEHELEFLVGHDCVYILPEKPVVKVWTEWREGNYSEIGLPEHADRSARRRYWFATLTHGTGPHPVWGDPATNGHYTVIYLPGKTLDEAKAWWAAQPFEILQQDVLAHRLYDAATNQTLCVQQWKGAFITEGKE